MLIQGEGFDLQTLTAAVNRIPYVPTFLGDLDMFEPRPVATTTVEIEEQDGVVVLVPDSERGSNTPAVEADGERRVVPLSLPRNALKSTIRASMIQNVRAFGGTALEGLQQKITEHQTALVRSINQTWEHKRLGAVRGEIVNSAGRTTHDLFATFGVAKPARTDFTLTGQNPDDLKLLTRQKKREIVKAGKGLVSGSDRVMWACGDDVFDALLSLDDFRRAYDTRMEAALREGGQVWEAVPYGGGVFYNYRGSDDDSVSIASDEVAIFPASRGVFEIAFGPADRVDTANTLGLPMYSWVTETDRAVQVHVESNALPYCKVPGVLHSAKLV